ncbi:MAG: BatD family protein [Chlamydiia bacterium]|nr:BatD family protein [Chlamydiia bacterium]
MVKAKIGSLTCILCLCWMAILSAEVKVSTELNTAIISENQPFDVYVKVFHDEAMQVDHKSFKLDGDPIEVDLINVAQQSSVTIVNGRRTEERYVIETFRFIAEGRPSGRYVLPILTLKVDGKEYATDEVTFEILAADQNGELRLEAIIDGVTPFYPGQKARFIYRIYSKNKVEITLEDLPLLKAEGFRLLGERKLRNLTRGGRNVLEVIQEVQAIKPGRYRFGSSAIEGFAYQETVFSRRRYLQPRLRAVAEPVSIEVASFPEAGKPPEFNGALGTYALYARLVGEREVQVGDKLEVEVRVSGSGEWETVQLPVLQQVRNFSGNFRLSDLPPIGQMKGEEKVFMVELRPLSDAVTEIPAIPFASFDPVSQKYNRQQTAPISITVQKGKALPPVAPSSDQQKVQEERSLAVQAKQDSEVPPPIQISGNERLRAADLRRQRPSSLWPTVLLLAGAMLLQVLWKAKRSRMQKKEPPPIRAVDLLQQARQQRADRNQSLALLEQALWLSLQESDPVVHRESGMDALGGVGLQGAYRELLRTLSAQRFAGDSEENLDTLLGKAEELIQRSKG